MWQSVFTHDILRADKGRVIRPKSAGQKAYVEAIADNVVTFGIGPAGTGKSWLAVAMACALVGTPLRIVRGVSNEVGDREPRNWRIPLALAAARELALKILASDDAWRVAGEARA